MKSNAVWQRVDADPRRPEPLPAEDAQAAVRMADAVGEHQLAGRRS